LAAAGEEVAETVVVLLKLMVFRCTFYQVIHLYVRVQ